MQLLIIVYAWIKPDDSNFIATRETFTPLITEQHLYIWEKKICNLSIMSINLHNEK